MTIEPRVIVSDDAFVANDSVVFPRTSEQTERIASLTWVISEALDRHKARLECLDLATRRVSSALPEHRLWLLACQSTWQPDTSRARSLRLWRWLKAGGAKTPARMLDIEVVQHAHSRGLKWFGVAEVGQEELSVAHDIISSERASFLVAALEPPSLDEYLAAGWAETHPALMTFWRDMALVGLREECLLFRPFGNFDDTEVGFNVIAAPEVIVLLTSIGSNL